MGTKYAYEKLILAVDALATGPGRIKERLAGAFLNGLYRVEEHFPEPYRERVQVILGDVTGNGTIEESIEMLSEKRCEEIAREIVRLYDELGEIDPINVSQRQEAKL